MEADVGLLRPLPSSDSAARLVSGHGNLGEVLFHMAGRGALLALGMWAGGVPPREIPRAAGMGTLAIETFALLWFAAQRRKEVP